MTGPPGGATVDDDLADVRAYRPPAAPADPERRFAVRPGDRRTSLSGPIAFRVGTWAHGVALLVLAVGMMTVLGLDPAETFVYSIMAALVGAPAGLGVGTLVSWVLGRALRRVPWLAVHLIGFGVAGGVVGGVAAAAFFGFDPAAAAQVVPVVTVAAGVGGASARALVERKQSTRLR